MKRMHRKAVTQSESSEDEWMEHVYEAMELDFPNVFPEALESEQVDVTGASKTTKSDTKPVINSDGYSNYPTARETLKKVGVYLGGGGFGDVFKVEKDGRDIALKIAKTRDAWETIQREANIYEKINKEGGHKNIAGCIGICEAEGVKGLGLECVDGPKISFILDTAKQMYESGKITHAELWGSAQSFLKETLEALAFLEENNLVHGDVKGENIMFDRKSKSIKLIDLGSACVAEEEEARMGTITNASPEVMLSWSRSLTPKQSASPRQDTYAVGQMAYFFGEGDHNRFGAPDLKNEQATLFQLVMTFKSIAASKKRTDSESLGALNPVEDHASSPGAGQYGRGGGNTAYVKFVNAATNFDPNLRSSSAELLEMDFFKDPLLQEEDTVEVFEKLLQHLDEEMEDDQ